MKKYYIFLSLLFLTSYLVSGQQFLLQEDFDSNNNLPTGWSTAVGATYQSVWEIGDNLSSPNFQIPAHTGNYAVSNDDACNCEIPGDTLLTPAIDFTGLSNVTLKFDSYLPSPFGALGFPDSKGYIYIQQADGDYILVQEVSLFAGWNTVSLSLDAFVSGIERIAFVHSDEGSINSLSGWAIDNVVVSTPYALDIAVTGLLVPMDDCQEGNVGIQVELTNLGTTTLTDFDISFQVNGGTLITETVNSVSIPFNGIYIYTFTNQFLFEGGNSYSIAIAANLTGDQNSANDGITETVIKSLPVTLNQEESFDNDISYSWFVVSDSKANSSISGGQIVMQGSGQAGWITTGGVPTQDNVWQDNSDYHSIVTITCNNNEIPAINNGLELSFDLRQEGFNVSTNSWLAVFINDNQIADVNGNLAFNPQSTTSDQYQSRTFNLSAFKNTAFTIELKAATYRTGDKVFVDNLVVRTRNERDAGIVSIISPQSNCGLQSIMDLAVVIKNYGLESIQNIPVYYTINGGTAVLAGTHNTPISAGSQTGVVTFSNLSFSGFDLPGSFELNVYTQLPGDTIQTSNDGVSLTVVNQPTITVFPYVEDFEGDVIWSSQGVNSSWEVGLPAGNLITPESANSKALVTNPQGTYNNNEYSFATSPCLDFSLLVNPYIEFSIWYDTDPGADGSMLQYSIDNGNSWSVLGIIPDPSTGNPDNWYPLEVASLGGIQGGWTETSTGWLTARHDLTALAGESDVKFRFVFASDSDNTVNSQEVPYDGIAIDNLFIGEAQADIDLKVNLLLSPVNDINLSNNETISVEIGNAGILQVTEFTVSYTIDNGTPVSETFTLTILPGSSEIVTFSQTANLSSIGVYTIGVNVTAVNDGNPTNNAMQFTIVNQLLVDTYPYVEDFEGTNHFWTSGGFNNSWQLTIPNGTFITGDPLTNPASDKAWKTNLNAGGYFNSESSYVESPEFDFSSLIQPAMKMRISYKTETDVDGANLLVSIDGGSTFTLVGTLGTPPNFLNWYDNTVIADNGQFGWTGQKSWVSALQDLSSLAGETSVIFRVAFNSDVLTNNEGFAFDDFEVFENAPRDLELLAWVSQNNNCGLTDSEEIIVSVQNNGLFTETDFEISFSIDFNGNIQTASETVTGVSISPNGTYTHTFTTLGDFSLTGSYDVEAMVSLTGGTDVNPANNTFVGQVYSYELVDTYPYAADFETGNDGWNSNGLNNSFELGVPSGTNISAASSGNNAWVTNLDGNHSSLEDSYVESQCFDFTGLLEPAITFDYYIQSEINSPTYAWDGARLEYTLDGGNTWLVLGDYQTNGEWYNYSQIQRFGNTAGWAGNSGNWISVNYSLMSLVNEPSVRFRFVFKADATNTAGYEGFAFDNIKIFDDLPYDFGVSNISSLTACVGSTDNLITVAITNFSANYTHIAGSTIDVAYTFDGGAAIMESFILANDLLPNGSVNYTFSTPLAVYQSGPFTLSAYTTVAGDINTVNDETSVTFEVFVLPILTPTVTNVSCYSGSDGAIVFTNNADYAYLWAGNEITPALNGLIAGDYFITITNTLTGCEYISPAITVIQPAELSVSAALVHPDCSDLSGGSVTLTVTGGTPDYSYSWNNLSITPSISGLQMGVYSVTITDDNQCVLTSSYTLTGPMDLPFAENFEGLSLPAGWERSQAVNSVGWEFGTDINSPIFPFFEIPAHSGYAASNDDRNDDFTGALNDASEDLLLTPVFNFESYASVILEFDAYFNGFFDEASVLVISDNGATTDVVYTMTSSSQWQDGIVVNLDNYAGECGIQIGFLYNDGGEWATGFAIDNVQLVGTNQLGFDLSLLQVVSPIMESCAFTNTEALEVIISNLGSNDATGASISYTINGGTAVVDVLPTINSGDTYTYTAAVDLLASGQYEFAIEIIYAADEQLSNNSSLLIVNSLPVINQFPYIEDFSNVEIDFELNSNSESSLQILNNELVFAGGNPLVGWTGGSSATETNAFVTNLSHVSRMTTYCSIDANSVSTLELSFDLKQNFVVSSTDSWFRVLVNGNVVAGPFNPTQSTGIYNSIVVDFDLYAGGPFELTFEASNRSANDKVFVDNILLKEKDGDIALSLIEVNAVSCEYSNNETVTVYYSNAGSLTINSFDVTLYVNNTFFITQTINTPLLAGQNGMLNFTGLDFTQLGSYLLTATASLIDDSDLSNNTLETSITSLPIYSSFPFAETASNFENYWLAGGTNSSWIYSNGWQTGLNTYNDDEDSYLQSPCFDFSNLVNPVLLFDFSYLTENNVDFLSLEYTTDNISWTTLGTQGQGSNWYNSTNGWTGNSGVILTAILPSNLGGESSVKFRFVLNSDFGDNFDGASINTFEVFDAHDFAIVSVTPSEICSNSDFNVFVEIGNQSGSTIPSGTELNLSYSLAGNIVNEVYTLAADLLAGESFDYTFTATENILSISNYPFMVSVSSDYDFNIMNNAYSGFLNIIPGPVIGTSTDISICEGNSVTLTATGGLNYVWSDGVINGVPFYPNQTTTYEVTATSSNGCQSTSQTIVTVNPTPNAFAGDDQFVCNGETTTLTASGGSIYEWIGIGLGASVDIVVNQTNTYTVIVTDVNGCFDFSTVTVNSLALPIGGVSADVTICNDENTILTAIGGTSYAWSTGEFGSSITVAPLSTATYDVTITNDDECSVIESVDVNVLARPVVAMADIVPNYCFEGSAGSIELTVSGVLPVSYEWSDNLGTGNMVSNLPAGTYTVTIQDGLGSQCPTIVDYVITQPAVPIATSIIDVSNHIGYSISCNGANDGNLLAFATAGYPPYTYSWSNGIGVAEVSNLSPGIYTVTVEDFYGCSVTAEYTVTEPAILAVTADISDVTCNGFSNGEIDLSVTGGTASYEFNWTSLNIVNSANVLSNLDGGTYNLIITDANGCTITDTYNINEPQPLIVVLDDISDYNGYEISCTFAADGYITVHAEGGNGGYSYLWSNGSTGLNLSNLTAGTYTFTVTDNLGCSTVESFVMTQPFPISTSISSTNVLCFGGNNGAINLNVSFGGVPPFQYNWSNGATTEDLSNLIAGVYTVTITDDNGCSVTISRTISQPAEFIATAYVSSNYNGSDVSCPGSTNGSASVNVIGGVLPYNYLWDVEVGAGNQTISSLSAGTYEVTVTDGNGCTSVSSVSIVDPETIVASVDVLSQYGVNITNVSCFGASDGSAEVTAVGGSGLMSYDWSNGSLNAAIATDLSAGLQTVTVSDANGCFVVLDFELTEPAPFMADIIVQQAVSCTNDDDGSLSVVLSGGVGMFTYEWSNGETTQMIDNLTSGMYSVTVVDENNCVSSAVFNLPNPTPVNVGIVATSNYNGFNVSCFEGNDGSLQVNTTGGTGTYTYEWTNPTLSGSILTNIPALAYSVTATDSNGCTDNAFIVLTQPSQIIITETLSDYAGFNIDCNGNSTGAISISVTGGFGSYSYAWATGSTDTYLDNLEAGSYTVSVTDGNGCLVTEDYTLTEADQLTLGFTTSDNNGYAVSCFGGQDGEIEALVAFGVEPYTYEWSDGETTSSLMNLEAGTYMLTVTDANGCLIEGSIEIFAAPALEIAGISSSSDYNGFEVSCFDAEDGIATVQMLVGIAPFEYLWSSGETTATAEDLVAGINYVTITDANLCYIVAEIDLSAPAQFVVDVFVSSDYNGNHVTCTGSEDGVIEAVPQSGFAPYTYNWSTGNTGSSVSGLGAGTYSVTVTDGNGCVYVSDVTIEDASPVSYTYSLSNVTCNGANDGFIDVNVTGGTGSYMYFWNNAANTEDIANLMPGVYYFLAIDQNWCHIVSELFYITEPAVLTAVATATTDFAGYNVSCFNTNDAAVSTVVSGGTEPYSYLWSNGSTDMDLSNIGAGTYGLTVADFNGCQVITQVVVTAPIEFTADIDLSDFNGYSVSCNGSTDGSILITPVNGESPITYAWDGGYVGSELTGLTEGSYQLTMTDANGCVITRDILLTEPAALAIGFSVVSSYNGYDISCYNSTDGEILSTVTGGVNPYSYTWSNGAVTTDISNGVVGLNTLMITDANGCTLEASVSLSSPPEIVVTISESNSISCYGSSNGELSASVIGGMGSYSYLWNTGATTATISNLAEGNYSLTVTDGIACIAALEYELIAPELLALTIDVTNPACNGQTDGEATANVTGGVEPYSYYWSNGEVTQTISDLGPGVYYLFVLDANNCASTFVPFEIIDPATFSISLNVIQANVCGDDMNGAIDLTMMSQNGNYSYEWSNGATTEDLVGLGNGTYTVTVSNATGCDAIETATISSDSYLVMSEVVTDIVCAGDETGSISLLVTGGSGAVTYSWQHGASTDYIDMLAAGTYFVTVSDAIGCTLFGEYTLATPALIEVSTSITHVSCSGLMDGEIIADLSGGVAPYTYTWSNGETTLTNSGLSAGLYTLSFMDANSCSGTADILIQEPSAILVDLIGLDEGCADGALGSIQAMVTGGSGIYTYIWSNGATDMNLDLLTAATYTLSVTDDNNCSVSAAITLNSVPPITISETIDNASCNGSNSGEISLSVTGGSGTYFYYWEGNDIGGTSVFDWDYTITDVNHTIVIPMTADINVNGSDIAVGDYIGVFFDNNGQLECAGYAVWTGSVTSVAAFGDDSGTAEKDGFTFGESFQWIIWQAATGRSFSATPVYGTMSVTHAGDYASFGLSSIVEMEALVLSDLVDLVAGNYFVTVSDENACYSTASFNVTQPDALMASSLVIDASCAGVNDGSIEVTVVGGTEPYSYSWLGGETTSSLTGLSSGDYFLTITDYNGCTMSHEFVVEVGVIVLDYLAVEPSVFGGSDGSITLNVTGGLAPYTYNWIDGETTMEITSLVAGDYFVTVTDANNCIIITQIVLGQPAPPLVVDFTSTQPTSCLADGSIIVTVSGGTGDYSFEWNEGSTTQSLIDVVSGTYSLTVSDANGYVAMLSDIVLDGDEMDVDFIFDINICNGGSDGAITAVVNNQIPVSFEWSNGVSNDYISGLTAGYYTVTITDLYGCDIIQTVMLEDPAPMLVEITTTSIGFQANLISGFVSPVTYLWSNGKPYQSIKNLMVGQEYCVTVTDANGCQGFACAVWTGGGIGAGLMASKEDVIKALTELDITLYPNPTRDGNINIELPAIDLDRVVIEIVDNSGRIIYQEALFNNYANTVQANLGNLRAGIYFARINLDDIKVITKRIVVIR